MGFFDLDEPYCEPKKPPFRKVVFDLVEGERRKEVGMRLVMDNNPSFRDQHRKVIDALPRGWIGNTQDIRKMWKPEWPQPHHDNCWGSNWRATLKRGDVVMLPFRQPARIPESHKRGINLYKKV